MQVRCDDLKKIDLTKFINFRFNDFVEIEGILNEFLFPSSFNWLLLFLI